MAQFGKVNTSLWNVSMMIFPDRGNLQAVQSAIYTLNTMEQEKKHTRKRNSDRSPRYFFVGDREFRIGQKIRIQGIVDKGEKVADRDLNGRIGTLVEKFKRIPFGVVGAYVKIKTDYGTKMAEVNLNLNEFVIINGEQ